MSLSSAARFHAISENVVSQTIYVCDSEDFLSVRRKARELINVMRESDSGAHDNELLSSIAIEIGKALSSPSIPDPSRLLSAGIGNYEKLKRLWGEEAPSLAQNLMREVRKYKENGSPLNNIFLNEICELAANIGEESIKIICHPNDRDAYVELLQGIFESPELAFICNLSDYRKLKDFHALVKFGPFRHSGFSRVPEAVVMSPKYKRLIRFVWEGLNDDEGFGCDPVRKEFSYLDNFITERVWCSPKKEGIEEHVPDDALDELQFPGHRESRSDGKAINANALFIEFPEERGLIITPGHRFLVYRPNENGGERIGYRHADEIESGDYIVIHDADADLGGSGRAIDKAPLAKLWKSALAEMYSRTPKLCLYRMQNAGISLRNLNRAVTSWMDPEGAVIHAPQSARHFRALVNEVLPKDVLVFGEGEELLKEGWELAWQEIVDSRVRAIQEGVIESAIVNEQLVAELLGCIDSISSEVRSADYYRLSLDQRGGLRGDVVFRPVFGVVSGLRVPADKIGTTCRSISADQYTSY